MTAESTDTDSTDTKSNDAPGRQVARRVFASEFDRTHSVVQEDDEQAPRFVVLPTGQTANRLLIVGTLTETADKGTDSEYWQARIVDPTGTFFCYAGQYTPQAQQFLREIEPPAYVSVVAKPGDPYETDDGEHNVPLNIEEINTVDTETRDRWVHETAKHTAGRVDAFDPEDPAEPAPMAHLTTDEQFHPDPNLEVLREDARNALRDIAEGQGSDNGEDASDGEEAEGEADGEEPVGLCDQLKAEVDLRDDGAGADRDATIESVADKVDADVEVVEQALEEAILEGDFYQPDGDGTVKTI